jgi:hypothetical protein
MGSLISDTVTTYSYSHHILRDNYSFIIAIERFPTADRIPCWKARVLHWQYPGTLASAAIIQDE